jgi:GTP pyrophosphokinase
MPDAYAMIAARLDDLRRKNGKIIVTIEKELTSELAARGIDAKVEGRQKQPYSVWRKMERKSIAFEQLSDIFGFRVIVEEVDDCYRVIGVVHTKWAVVPGRFKDYISTPKQNDYQSIHTTVVGPGRQRGCDRLGHGLALASWFAGTARLAARNATTISVR